MFMLLAITIGLIVGLTVDLAAGLFAGLLLTAAAYAANQVMRDD